MWEAHKIWKSDLGVFFKNLWPSQDIWALPTFLVNLFQKHLPLHQLTHNMKKIVHWFTSSVHENYKLKKFCVHKLFFCLFRHSKQFMYTCSELLVFMYRTGKSMNNLLSCGLVDTRIRTSKKIYLYWLTTYSHGLNYQLIFHWVNTYHSTLRTRVRGQTSKTKA